MISMAPSSSSTQQVPHIVTDGSEGQLLKGSEVRSQLIMVWARKQVTEAVIRTHQPNQGPSCLRPEGTLLLIF